MRAFPIEKWKHIFEIRFRWKLYTNQSYFFLSQQRSTLKRIEFFLMEPKKMIMVFLPNLFSNEFFVTRWKLTFFCSLCWTQFKYKGKINWLVSRSHRTTNVGFNVKTNDISDEKHNLLKKTTHSRNSSWNYLSVFSFIFVSKLIHKIRLMKNQMYENNI